MEGNERESEVKKEEDGCQKMDSKMEDEGRGNEYSYNMNQRVYSKKDSKREEAKKLGFAIKVRNADNKTVEHQIVEPVSPRSLSDKTNNTNSQIPSQNKRKTSPKPKQKGCCSACFIF